MQNWSKYEKAGWSWAVGWNSNYGGYYAQAWRDYPVWPEVDGRVLKRESFTEGGKSIDEAERKLQQRLDPLE